MQGEDIGLAVVLGGVTLGAAAIIGGVVTGIVRGYQRQRMLELVQRERIALIERGADPEKLPPISGHALAIAFGNGAADERVQAARRRQGLVIAGLLFTFFGVGLGTFLGIIAGEDVWGVGLIPFSIGLALLLGSRVVAVPEETAK